MRYRFYREHKYVTYMLFDLESHLAKVDFSDLNKISFLQEKLNSLAALMQGHALHEDEAIHALLRKKGSSLHASIEQDHHSHHEKFKALENELNKIKSLFNSDDRVSQGYAFYLKYRIFLSELLLHFHQEETVIMNELQRLCTDAELKTVDEKTYDHMTPEQIVDMIEVLFPHMNPSDHEFFLNDIKEAQPDKNIIHALTSPLKLG